MTKNSRKMEAALLKPAGKTPTVNHQQTQRIVDELLDIRTGLFTVNELHAAKKQIKRGKASGLDTIPTEVWLTGDFDNEILNFCNSVYQQDQITRWAEGYIAFSKER